MRLDLKNPRILQATSQREALQKIIDDQDLKLVLLAESIVKNGLNPMDRFLVVPSEDETGKYTVIEGNRRFAAIKILQNPTVLTGLNVRTSVQKRLEALALDFDVKTLEPLDCFEVPAREDGAMWIQQRHTGENQGRGIVDWNGVARARFRGSDPALQALDFVLKHGELQEDQQAEIENNFPITTLDRLLSTPDVRSIVGIEITGGKLLTGLPFDEVMKPLSRMVRDLASNIINVTKLKLQPQMVAYAKGLGTDLPDLSQLSDTIVPVEDLVPPPVGGSTSSDNPPPNGGTESKGGKTTGSGTSSSPKKPRATARKTLVPRGSSLNVANPKIAEIAKELRTLPLANYPHAISVLLRVFLELSVDQYLTHHGIALRIKTPGGPTIDKKLQKKVAEAIDNMVSSGVPTRELDGIRKGISDKHNPLHIDTLHNYIHNAFYSPTERDLTVAWDNAQPFFERLWP
ncbi:ParB/Srx family N-terminal domain-containing protein [Acidomonas methanolica]|uniref:ParB/Sulfiredoxin domain-containing protein n=2 Tax=Acidomonas methanolica TaxID=437 RepID=A0A023D9A4_ACIMT|nr:ParB/Srx family N-terminal domain-containing protein [Acidomonas methanolica]MBU2655560.1 ParB/Srx family N-terminal domain-containing protein [Acidomonas methanolica]GAJ30714.1 hypothetical protein Amme_246_004 [Acidomonas methanolica NBRC 104435]GBQ49685.1 hypothetical protein AA0498_1045 [Acidomonas methanolica]GEL00589.1 hypothetical protein AME01nite_30870 [Acidomonas methanolica NBRC 104435]